MRELFTLEAVGALGIGAILLFIVQSLWAWFSGKAHREENAWRQRDLEARARRKLEEYVHALRTHIIVFLQGNPEDIPPPPDYETSTRKRDDD